MKTLLCSAILGLCLQPALAIERFWMKHGEIAELFDKFQSIPPERRDRLEFRVKVLPMNKAPLDGISLRMHSGASPTPIAVDADGVIAFPNAPQLRQENPAIWIDSPQQVKVALGIDVRIMLPAGEALRYRDAMELVDRAGSGIRKHAGIWALFMPKPEGLELRFGGSAPATVVAQLPGGERRFTSNAQGLLMLPMDDELISANPTLQMSRPPLEARPYFSKRMQLVPDGEMALK